MNLPRLIVITDWSLGAEVLLPRLAAALSLGPQVAVQHRHRGAPGRQFLEEAQAVAEIAARAGCAFFVNGRLDVALLTGAHLHLPARGPGVTEVRSHLPRDRWVSVAVHGEAELSGAAGADLALVAPVFPAGSKPGDSRPALGPAGFFALAARLPCPALALGGITPQSSRALAGAAGLAAVSSVLRSPDAKLASASLLAAL